MLKICAVCGNGLGSSLIMEMAIKEVTDDLKVEAEVTHLNLSSYTTQHHYDVIVCAEDLSQYIDAGNAYKIALFNILDKVQIKKQLIEFLKQKKG